ncbi:MAG: hypothetical protein U0573_15360 [Phycisphaerales bacterium]|nr:hypothetical protein [Planctomycetota bacterium]
MTPLLTLAQAATTRASLGRGVILILLLSLGLVALIATLLLIVMARRRARISALARETRARLAEDPWKASAERTEVPSPDELYRASGFDNDDTRIENTPDFGDSDPMGPGGPGPDKPKPPKPPMPPPGPRKPPAR